MAKHMWRFQCDVPLGVTDPDVTAFMGETFTRSDGSYFVEQSISDPVVMKLSAIIAYLQAIDDKQFEEEQKRQIEERKPKFAEAPALEPTPEPTP